MLDFCAQEFSRWEGEHRGAQHSKCLPGKGTGGCNAPGPVAQSDCGKGLEFCPTTPYTGQSCFGYCSIIGKEQNPPLPALEGNKAANLGL